MPAEGYFMAMGGLGLSLAGFARLPATFHRGGTTRPEIYKWRISAIVMGSLFVLFLGFGVVPIHTWVGMSRQPFASPRAWQ